VIIGLGLFWQIACCEDYDCIQTISIVALTHKQLPTLHGLLIHVNSNAGSRTSQSKNNNQLVC